MKDPTLSIRAAFLTLITTAVPGLSVVDNTVATGSPKRKIVLSGQNYASDGGDKDSFGGTANIDVDINSVYAIGTGGGKWSDETATAITQAVSPSRGVCALSVTGFRIITASAQVLPFAPLAQPTSGEWIHRKIVRFTLQIVQL